jgi:hypothetical protein
MNRTIRTIALFGAGTMVLSFVVLVVNQTAQVVMLAKEVNPALGTVTLWSLLAAYAGMVGVPVVMLFRLPSPLVPPEKEEGEEFEAYLKKLGERLSLSPHLTGRVIADRAAVEEALGVLAARSDEIVRRTATGVFLSTAVSQSGRLDGLIVLAAQSRMVWQIAHVYYQRPTVKDMLHLYANVAGTTFIAGELQDFDLGSQVEPILSSALGALGASLPGLHVAGAVLTNCVLDGSANAFLTLRVGMIAKRYCGALVVQPQARVRNEATREAAGFLGAIVAEGSKKITGAVLRAAGEKVNVAVSGVSTYAKDAGAKFMARVRSGFGREQPEMS